MACFHKTSNTMRMPCSAHGANNVEIRNCYFRCGNSFKLTNGTCPTFNNIPFQTLNFCWLLLLYTLLPLIHPPTKISHFLFVFETKEIKTTAKYARTSQKYETFVFFCVPRLVAHFSFVSCAVPRNHTYVIDILKCVRITMTF